MSATCMCMRVPTPQSIKDDDNIDVFSVLLGGDTDDQTHPYRSEQYRALWARFRYRGVGNTDITYWQQCLSDKLNEISPRYDVKFATYEGFLTSDYDDLAQTVETIEIDYDETPGTTTQTYEDMPDTTASAGTYLSNRNTTTQLQTSGNHDTERKVYEGLPSTTAKQAIADVPDPYAEFAREFDVLFCGRLF